MSVDFPRTPFKTGCGHAARGRAEGGLRPRQAPLPVRLPPRCFFFFFFITLGLELSDTKVYEPYIRALLELLRNTASVRPQPTP